MPRRIRPPRSALRLKQLCVSLDQDTLAQIDQAANADSVTRSALVRDWIEWALMDRDGGGGVPVRSLTVQDTPNPPPQGVDR